MAALTNQVAAADVVSALDIEMANNFSGEVNKLAEVIGLFGVETMAAGTALYQYTVDGSLNAAAVAEGDEVPLSKYTLKKTPIGELAVKPYRKLTTSNAILKGGFVGAVSKTDAKMVKDIRAAVLADFFTFLGKGTGTAEGNGLKAALAKADAALGNAMEANADSADRIIHFVNRDDIAEYLATSEVTTQTVFGMEYLKSFLGISDIFVTSKVAKGTVYVTPVDNIHLYGVDFAALGQAGLEYQAADGGMIGVHHEANYARTAAETYALVGTAMVPEAKNYIIKATIKAAPVAV